MTEGRVGTLFIEQVTNLDCAVFHPSKGIEGQSWQVGIELTGNLDDQGFVYDFSKLKKLIRQVLKESIDHALVIPVGSKNVHFEDGDDLEHWQLRAQCSITGTNDEWSYRCPNGAVYPIRCKAINQSILEDEIARVLRHRLPDSVLSVKVSLRGEVAEKTVAFFKYTHGITNHDGLCQRLFHGHRSRIEIHVGEERRPDLEHYIARDIFGQSVHIACPRQFVEGPSIAPGERGEAGSMVTLAYEASHGEYRAYIPANRVFVVDEETSIECMAAELAKLLKPKAGPNPVRVRIYEGIGKGAIGFA